MINKPFIEVPRFEDNPGFGEDQRQGFITGTYAALEHELDYGLTRSTIDIAKKLFDTSEFLSPEEYNKSEYKRPGLNFGNGVHLETAKRAADRYDKKLEYEQTIGSMNNGFLRGTSQLVGGSIGFLLDPTNLAITAKIPMLVGAKAAPYVMKMAESPLAKRALQAGLGFAEGAAIMAPQEIASFAADNMYGEDPGVLNPLINIGLGGVLGGAIRGAFGFREHITTNVDNVAKETAVNQLAAGKSVRVDELMRHGAYEADLRAMERNNIAAMPKTREQLFVENLGDRIRADNQARNAEAFISDLQKSREELLPLTGNKLSIHDAKSLTQEIQGLRTKINSLDKSFDDYLARIREENKQSTYKEAVGKANKALANDKQPLQDALATAETKLKNHEAAKASEAELSRIEQHMAEIRKSQAIKPELLKSLDKLFEPLLINKPISVKRILDGDYNLEHLIQEPHANTVAFNIARQRIQNNVAQVMLDARETKPLTADQIKAASEHMQSYKSDSTYNAAESESFRNEVNALPENIEADIEHIKKRVDSFKETLPEDLKFSMEELKSANENIERVDSAIQNIINCLRGE